MSQPDQKRNGEEDCIKKAILSVPQLRRYRIDTSRYDNNIQEERPDFILISPKNERIGVEHFLVDTLFDTKTKKDNVKHHSYSRQHPNKINQLFDKYKDGKVIGNEQNALDDIIKQVKTTLSYEANFDSSNFCAYFLQTASDHAKKVLDYRKAKDGFGNSISRLGFICEVKIAGNDFKWNVLDNGGWHKQIINGIPMLEGMWILIYILLQLGFIDFFIITTISVTDNNVFRSLYYDKTTPPNIKTYKEFEYPITGLDMNKVDIKNTIQWD